MTVRAVLALAVALVACASRMDRSRANSIIFALALASCGREGFDAISDAGVDSANVGRSTLTLDRVAPGETLVDFPVPIVLDDSRADLVMLTPETLRAFATDGTELAIEIETAGPPLVAWVRVPRIEGTDTTITLEYGGALRTAADVWDASYLGVWHMQTAGLDSSPYARASTVNTIIPVAGVLGGAAAYTPLASSCIVVPSFNGLQYQQATMTGWMRLRASSGGQYTAILQRQFDDAPTDDFLLGTDPGSQPLGALDALGGGSPSRLGPTPLTIQTWHHLAFTYNGASSALMLDGIVVETSAASGVPRASLRPLFIGCGRNVGGTPIDQPDGDYPDGELDEVRFENVGRSPAWITYSYRAQLDQVITYGPVAP